MQGIRLQEMSWQDVATYLQGDDRIIIPVGSTEQHGRFAPLGTDTYVATSLAEDAASQEKVLVAPPLWFGWSPHHLVQPGTISIRAEILLEVLFDALESLATGGFHKFVLVNGHRLVNIPWMQIAAERAQRKLGVRIVIFDPAYMSKECTEFSEPIGHGEEIEISHLLHSRPELIRLEHAGDNPIHHKPLANIDPKDPRDTLCYIPATVEDMQKIMTKSGDTITGSPTKASAARGKRYHEHLVKRLVTVLRTLQDERG